MKQALESPAAKTGRRHQGHRIDIVSKADLRACKHWHHAFAHTRKDDRYYEIVEDTIMPDFVYRYFAVRDGVGNVRSVQPFFLLDQDLLEGSSHTLRAGASIVRLLWPRFLKMRTLMLGCVAGEAHLDRRDGNATADAALLAREIVRHAKALGARLIVLKEFPSGYRRALNAFANHGFARIPSLPMVVLNLDYRDFDDYLLRGVTARMRSDLRRKFRASASGSPITLEIVRDVSGVIDEIYPLYLQVYERSDRHFEKLTREYFIALGRRMPDKSRFFIWRSDGHIVAFSLTMVHGDHICNEYLGLDYDVALDRHLYFVAFRDVISWAIANGYKRCLSGGMHYDPKLNLGFTLYPVDLYVRHVSDVMNGVLKHLLPLIEPTRSEPILRRFRNYDEIWANDLPREAAQVSGSVVKNSG